MAIRNIMCPVDFTSMSEQAFEYAVRLAGNFGAQLELLHVNWPMPAMMTHPAAMAGAPNEGRGIAEAREETARNQLLQMGTRARGAGVDVSTRVRSGDVPNELRSQIEAKQPDLIVMGTHERDGFDRWLYGSVTERTVRRCRASILAVPESESSVLPVPPDLGKILLATDSVEGIERMLDAVRGLRTEAEMDVLHIVEKPEKATDALVGLSSVLDVLAPRYELDREKLVPRVEFGVVDEQILEAAVRARADLIVVNPHDRGWLGQLFGATTAESVIREAPCPVLTVPDANERSTAGGASAT